MNFLFLLTLLIYLAASIFHALFLATGSHKISRVAYWTTAGGFTLHTVFIGLRWFEQGHFIAHWHDSTTFFAWAIILIFLGIAQLTRLRPIGVFVVPAAFIAILIAYTFPKDNIAIPASLQNYWLLAHTTLIFLSYAAFISAFGFGLMYIIEENKIREKNHTLVYRLLPSIGYSDEWGHRCIVIGVTLLTMGIVVGAIWTQYAQELVWRWLDAKIILTLTTWLIYVSQLVIRQILGWRGRKTAYSSIIGFGAILFTYIGVNLLLPSVHDF